MRKNQQLHRFSRQVSHELKTPLTSLLGTIENLSDYHNDMDGQQLERF